MVTLETIIEQIQELIETITDLDYATGGGDPVNLQEADSLHDVKKQFGKILEGIKQGEFLSPRVKIS